VLDCGQIAERVGGRLTGPADVIVVRLAAADVGGEGALCFVRRSVGATPSCAALLVDALRPGFEGPQIVVPDVDTALPDLFALFAPEAPDRWGPMHACGEGLASGSAQVSRSARVGPGALIGPGAVVGEGAEVGAGAIVEWGATVGPGASLGSGAVVGWGCVVGPGSRVGRRAVIGSEGFGFAPSAGGLPRRIPHLGIVVLEAEVEVGAGSTVDRGTLGETRIGAGTKLDNLVHVAHNVTIGRGGLVAAQSGIAGSATVGDGVQFGGQVGVVGHLRVGHGAKLAAQTGVISDVPDGAVYGGTPAMPIATWRRVVTAWKHLPDVLRRLRASEADAP